LQRAHASSAVGESKTEPSQGSSPKQVAVERISTSPFQPRRSFDEAKIAELASSIRNQGIIQPLIVRPKNDGFELIAGERRWRAAMRAGLSHVPILIRDEAHERKSHCGKSPANS
jgi:ParB family chromosome partitioning protein